MRANYRRGGFFLLPSVLAAMIVAMLLSAPPAALISIGICGFGTAFVLVLAGGKSRKKENRNQG